MKAKNVEKHFNALLKCSKEDFRVKNLPYLRPFKVYIEELKYNQILEIVEYAEKREKEIYEIFSKDPKVLVNGEEAERPYAFDIWLEYHPDYNDIDTLYGKLRLALWELNYLQDQQAKAEIEYKVKQEKKLKVKQIALIHVFENKQI